MDSLDSRIAQIASGSMRRQLGSEVLTSIQRQDFESALRICDALIFFPENDLDVLCNALWLVQPDNTGLPLDEAMAKRFLAATVFRARFNPAMHINAAGVYAHLGDPEPVLRHLLLAKQHDQDLSSFLDDPLFERARSHPRWSELTGAHEPVDEPTWMEVALDACEHGDYANAVPALWWFWSRTRSSRAADLVEAASERAGVRVGYRGEALEATLRDSPESLRKQFHKGGHRGHRTDGSPATQDDMHEDLVWLAHDATDPRFTSAMLRLLGSSQLPAKKTVQDGLSDLLNNLQVLGDKRIAPGLAQLSQDLLKSEAPLDVWLAGELGRLSGSLAAAPEPALTPEECEACARLETLLGPPKELSYTRPVVSAPHAEAAEVDPLLALWRSTRNPDVADVLELQRMREPRTPALEQQVRDAEIPGEGSKRDVGAFDAAQLIWEAKHEHDPRLTTTLVRLFDDPPFLYASRDENGVEDFWSELVSACVSLNDLRLVAPLRALAVRFLSLTREADAEANHDMYMAFPLGPPVKRQLLKCADEIEAAERGTLDEEQRAMLESIRAEYAAEEEQRAKAHQRGEVRGDTAESLLSDLLGDLESDARRLAYADFLGDSPRANFIRLQIERAKGVGNIDVERALQVQHQDEWLEPLSHLLEDQTFERGFLSSCTVTIDAHSDPLAPEWIGHPLFATLRSLRSDADTWRTYDWDSGEKVPSNFVDAIAHPTMRSLVELDGVSTDGLFDLVSRGCTHYSLVTLEPNDIDESLWPAVIDALTQMKKLRTLRIRVSRRQELEGLESLLEAKALSHLALEVDAYGASTTALALPIGQEFLESVFARLTFAWKADNHDMGIDRCELRFTKSGERWSIEAEQLEDRLPHEFEEPPRAATQLWLGPFITRLELLPRDAAKAFRLVPNPASPSLESLEALSELLTSFPHLETLELVPAGNTPAEIDRLLSALEDPATVEHACRVLGSYKVPAARTKLAHHAAHNEVLSVRVAAVEALAEIADESVVPVLCDGLDGTPAGLMSARLLGYLQSKSAVPALIEYAPSIDTGYAWNHVAQAFTRIADPDAIPVLLESYQKQTNANTLVALARLGAPEAREFALTALESGNDEGAFAALAFVGQPEDCKLLERFFDSRLGVTHIRGVPLLASLAITCDASEAHIDQMATAIEKSWSSGVSEDCAWLALELGTRLDGPGAKWKDFAEQILQWCESCLDWSERTRADTSSGLNAREWFYWEDLLREVATVWR